MQEDPLIDVWQSSKCISGILCNSHSSPLRKAFCFKIAVCVPKLLLWVLCHRQFFGNPPFFLEWLLSKTSGDCFRFPLELLCLCFPCLISFKKYFKFLLVYVIRFWLVFRYLLMKNYLMVLKSQNFDFRIMFSYEINLKKFAA